ncbi:hypothetical protein [Endozoicomonas sp. ALB115]|uniref:hypothetical protein n=1 Tax=Endozoicomonas sp. ALB115 TaxID=3403074 RepID=UPI003BB76B37
MNKQMIKQLLKLNKIDLSLAPVFEFESIQMDSITAYAQAIASLVGSQALTPDPSLEMYSRNMLNIPQLEEEKLDFSGSYDNVSESYPDLEGKEDEVIEEYKEDVDSSLVEQYGELQSGNY